MVDKKQLAKQLIACLDLTRLAEHDPQALVALVQRAQTPFGLCASVCVYPEDLQVCRESAPVGLRFASVANFPSGDESLSVIGSQIDTMLAAGCEECDLVFPYSAFLSGDQARCDEVLQTVRDLFPGVVKIILETACFSDSSCLFDAAQCALDHGADFLKTGTGHVLDERLLDSVSVLLSVLKANPNSNSGIKVSGGVKTMDQAQVFWQLIEDTMGESWMNPKHVRFGASRLLDDIVCQNGLA